MKLLYENWTFEKNTDLEKGKWDNKADRSNRRKKYLFHFYDPVFGVYLRKGESEKRVKTLNNLMSHNKRNWTFTATARGPIERIDKVEVYVLIRLFVKHKGIKMISDILKPFKSNCFAFNYC